METNRGPIVGVFDEKSQAEQTIEDLYNAGVPSDHISYSETVTGGGFLESIKHLFTGRASMSSSSLIGELTSMGLSRDEASYYAQEHDAGRFIVAVRGTENAPAIMNILHTNGAYDYHAQRNRGLVMDRDIINDTTDDNRRNPAYTDRAETAADYTPEGTMHTTANQNVAQNEVDRDRDQDLTHHSTERTDI